MLFPTTLVGSYAQPDWLVDRFRIDRQTGAMQRVQ